MKVLWMIPRDPKQTEPPQDLEWAVVGFADQLKLQMPSVRAGWRREGKDTVEIGPVEFSGSKPIWYWEVK